MRVKGAPHEARGAGGGDRGTTPVTAETFEEFYAREAPTLFRRMWLVTRDRFEAEEIAQDAFVIMYERWDRVAHLSDRTAYLYRVSFNVWKRRARRARRALDRFVSAPHRTDAVIEVEARTIVGDALRAITPRQRAALVLTELIGMSSDEAANVLGIRPSTVRALATQGRAAIREQLAGRDG
jgi:RNA polymerase sigma factor (sigma-70 family)